MYVVVKIFERNESEMLCKSALRKHMRSLLARETTPEMISLECKNYI